MGFNPPFSETLTGRRREKCREYGQVWDKLNIYLTELAVEIVIAAREMCTNVREEKSEQQIKGSKEKKKGNGRRKRKRRRVFCFLCVSRFLLHSWGHSFLHPAPPPLQEVKGWHGSLCYLETDSLTPAANQRLRDTASCLSIGPLLPGTHSTMSVHIIVSSGAADANYAASSLCSDLLSPADSPSHL